VVATIYVVIGSSGFWADATTWNVCFKSTKEEADAVCKLCQEQADEYTRWYKKKRPISRSFFKRHTPLQEEEFAAEEQAKREAMFDKWFSWDRDGAKYVVHTLAENPSEDPRWLDHQAWWKNWQDEQRAEQLKHCTLDDRSAFAKLGDLIKAKLTMK
jgi:hypothetical protein